MVRHGSWAVLATVVLTAGVRGQDVKVEAKAAEEPRPRPVAKAVKAETKSETKPEVKPEAGPPVKPNEVEVRLADGSILRMSVLQESLEVLTAFGKLTVPTLQVRKIDFGMRLPDDVARKVEAALKKFNSESFDQREAATNELIAIGTPAYPALRDAAESSDAEVAQRARAAMKKIREKPGAGVMPTTLTDRIETNLFTIVGQVVSPSLKARGYFGESELKVSDLRAVRWLSANSEKAIEVNAATFNSGNNQWMDTGIQVEVDVTVRLEASGQVNLNQDAGGEYMTGPAGNSNWGRRGPYPPGALIGRIGDKGAIFIVGERHKLVGTAEGRLFLSISPSPWNQSTGSYKVKIAAGRNLGGDD